MKNRRPENAFDRLYAAAVEIADTARGVVNNEGPRADLYLPIQISGTDMRICIEQGPSIAAANAIGKAKSESGGVPDKRFEEALRQAVDVLARISHEQPEARMHIDSVIAALRGVSGKAGKPS